MLTLPHTLSDSAATQPRYLAGAGQPLLLETLGPWPHCQALVWEQLVDFGAWTDWLTGIRAVHRLDSGLPGRGSRLQIQKSFASEFWEIIHWHHARRLDFEIDNPHCRIGFSVSLHPGIDENHVVLRLDSESVPGNNGWLMACVARRRLQGSGVEWLRAFTDYFRSQKPPAD